RMPADEAQGLDARQEEVRAADEPRELRHVLVLAAHRRGRARERVVAVVAGPARGGDRIAVLEQRVEVGRVDPRALHELELTADAADEADEVETALLAVRRRREDLARLHALGDEPAERTAAPDHLVLSHHQL